MHFEYNFSMWRIYTTSAGMKILLGIFMAITILPFRNYTSSEIMVISFFIICFIAFCLYSRYQTRNVFYKLVWDGNFITLSNKYKKLKIQVVDIKRVKILYVGSFMKLNLNTGSSARLQVDLFNDWRKIRYLVTMLRNYVQQSK